MKSFLGPRMESLNKAKHCISFGAITAVYLRITLLWVMKLCQWVVGS